jgi:nucleotide-binding universal stress UspA family protein
MVFSHILLPLDGSQNAELALTHAGRIARVFKSRVTMLQVINGVGSNGRTGSESIDWRLRRAESERYLKALAQDSRLNDVEVDICLTEGRPADRIGDHIRRHGIKLVIMSAWGAGGENEFPYGGTAHKVLTNSDISFLVVRGGSRQDATEPYRRILVPLDGSQKAELAAHVAIALDADHQADIQLYHVVCEPIMPRRRPLTEAEVALRDKLIDCNRRVACSYLDDLRDQLGGQHTVHTRLDVAPHPVRSIAHTCREERPDLMVMTAHGGGELNGWSGESIMQSVLATVNTPVLALQDAPSVPGIGSNAS